MDFVFTDDGQLKQPPRPGMGPLVAVGGICIPGEAASKLEGENQLKGCWLERERELAGLD